VRLLRVLGSTDVPADPPAAQASYHRCVLLRESTANSIVMIQPALVSYSAETHGVGTPVLLDSGSIRPDTILLLDTFFHVVVFHGENIVHWREAKYQDMPEHAAFRHLLHAPKDDAQFLMQSRIPQPRYIVCDQGKSQSRFLVSKVNPSVTHNSQDSDTVGGQTVFTDDASFKSFFECVSQPSDRRAD
jgi:protein transport protein SEC23